VSLPVAGQLITAFAVTICVAAPLLAGATSRYDRRALLVAMQLILFLGHLGAALVSSFIRCSAYGSWLRSAPRSSRRRPPRPPRSSCHRRSAAGRSPSSSSAGRCPGCSASARFLHRRHFGWRAGFGLVAALAAIGAAAVWSAVPAGSRCGRSTARCGARSWEREPALGRRGHRLMAAASFALFAYFVPPRTLSSTLRHTK